MLGKCATFVGFDKSIDSEVRCLEAGWFGPFGLPERSFFWVEARQGLTNAARA
jgi:hypothetical protein